jgi:glycosyltransferase involved in cell wall biosynthesis
MHVLFLPKWYPGRKDPQLGDFLRKQALAAAAHVRMSVVHVEAMADLHPGEEMSLTDSDGAWELTVRYRASQSSVGAWRKSVNFLRYWSAAKHGWQRVVSERGRPDLIHAYILVRPALFAWWTAGRNNIPYIVSEQSSEYLDGTFAGKSELFKWISRSLFKRAAAITAVSEWLGDALVQHRLCSTFAVVPNVIPGLDRPLPPPGTPGHFLVVADLVDRTKNVSGVLRALHQARRTEPRIALTVIGDGPDRPALEALAAQLDIAEAIRFLGRLPNAEVLEHTGRTFAAIVNSNVETFSVVTGEALAQGKPVIATRCGGPVAFITPENGTLINVRDDAALAQAMIDMTNAADDYDPVRIRQSVSDRFSPEAVGRAFVTIYQRALRHGS